MTRALVVAGARPNFMKIAPIVPALEARGVEVVLVHTGQHYDPAMSDVFFDELDIRTPDLHLEVGSSSHARQTARLLESLEPVIVDACLDLVVVVGDVNSTMAAALVAAKAGVPVAHVEAGLRSRDWAMPEEVNRVITDRCSSWLLAPSPDAVDNLRAEGAHPDAVHLVGNVMVDTLLRRLPAARQRDVAGRLGLPERYGLVTLHRPSNVDDDDVLADLVGTLALVAAEVPLVLPAHPRTRPSVERLGIPAGVQVVDPQGYLDFLSLQAGAVVALTDSGGVQEETTVLGVPCITLRESTERPITVDEGTNVVVGRDRSRILAAVADALAGAVPARRPALWDGRAAERIADVVLGQPPVDPTTEPGTRA